MEKKNRTIQSRPRDEFVARLPARLASIEALLIGARDGDSAPIESLHRAANGMVDEAGEHGLMRVADAARKLGSAVMALSASAGAMLGDARLADLHAAFGGLAAVAANQSHGFIPPSPAGRSASPTVAVANDNPEQGEWLRSVLEQAGYRVEVFADLHALRDACEAQDGLPEAVIMDMNFLERNDAGARIVAELKEKYLNGLQVIFLSERQDMAARLAAHRAGVTRYLTRPVDQDALLRALAESTVQVPAEPYRVLLVDDDPDQLAANAQILRQAGMTVREVTDPLQVPQVLKDFVAEVLVLDMCMPQCSGPELAAILRDEPGHAQVPIIYLSVEADFSRQLPAPDLGGDTLLSKPVKPRHMVAAVNLYAGRLRRAREQAETLRATLYERERQQQALNAHAIVSITDASGIIIYVNDRFCQVSGYSRNALLGSNHRIVKSGEHPPSFYEDLWSTICNGRVWQGEICNRRRDGGQYWVESTIVPFLDQSGLPYQYVSIRTDITAIKQREQSLRVNARAIEASPLAVTIADANDPEMPLIYVNPTFERMTGYSRSEVLGRNCRFLQGEDRDQVPIQDIRAALKQGQPVETLLRNYRKDGSLFWNALHLAPVWDHAGRMSHVIGIAEDVTEFRRVNEALRESEERLRRSQGYANIGTWDWNIGTGALYWSERIGPLFGYPEGKLETTYGNFLNTVHRDDRQKVIDAVNACIERGEKYDIEHRCVWPDGSVRWMLERGDVVRAEDGTPLHMLGVVQDITERKLAELALEESRERLAYAQTLAKLGYWSLDVASQVITWSDEVYAIFGRDPATFRPELPTYYREIVHPDDVEALQSEEQAAYTSGRTHNIDHRFLHTDGSVRWIHVEGEAEHDSAGRPTRLAGTVQDITVRKRTEHALVAAREEADRANEAKSEFLSSMSHELRTPMNAILGFGQLLDIDSSLDAEQRESVREILKAGHHLLELINEVLDLARIESGKIDLSVESVALHDLVSESLGLIEPLAVKHGIVVSCDIPDQWAVQADRMRLKQVLLNLLSNAVKYNRPQGKLRIQVFMMESRVRLSVTDTGIGIEPARLSELFQPFHRLVGEDSKIEGTGVGLTISRRLVELMGGRIGVESRFGEGSTFWIELPPGDHSSPAEFGSARGASPASSIAGQAQHSVLYVEDNPANLKLVYQLLARRRNIRLLTAHTPSLGLELARECRPDLILLDINLPGMDGYEVLRLIRSAEWGREMPMIAVTANAMPRDIERGRAAGFADYLTKPIDVARFYNLIDEYLGLRN